MRAYLVTNYWSANSTRCLHAEVRLRSILAVRTLFAVPTRVGDRDPGACEPTYDMVRVDGARALLWPPAAVGAEEGLVSVGS